MKQDLQTLFNTHKSALDSEQTPDGHAQRFMEKLNTRKIQPVNKQRRWLKPLAIAATFLVLITIGTAVYNISSEETNVVSLSPEMEQTQSFFTTTINRELSKLEAIEDPELKELINETLIEIDVLETQYNSLRKDLLESGHDSRVIAAMIANFQDRIDLLENISNTIEEIKTLKNSTYETTL